MPHSEKALPNRPLPATNDRIFPYAIALLLLPVLVLWRHDDPLYTPLWQADPWFYLGYFRDLVSFKRDLFPGFYYGSRLSWILPGYVAHRLFSPLLANAILHLSVHSISVLSLFSILRRTIGLRSAYLTAMIFSLYPWFWAATGWDYVSGGAIAYLLLAMALLTRAAAQPVRKWSLILAGMAIAGSVHAQLYLLALAPLLLLHYIGLTWAWHGTAVTRSVRAFCLWPGAGFVIFTLPICVINGLLVDGNPWFWSPSLRTAQAVTQKYAWTESLWYENQLVPYLWFIVVAVVAAIALLPSAWKQSVKRPKAAGLLFSTQLLLATSLMVFLQSRGITLLGHYYYACYLFPFVFLVLGASFWPAVESMKVSPWMYTCCLATLLFGLPWIDPPANPVLTRLMPQFAAFLLAGGVLAIALVLRRRVSGTWLALSGIAMFTSLTYSGSYRWVNIHGTRQEYMRVMNARHLIEGDRHGASVRFWYDREEPAFHEYFALNASYLAEFARIGERFPLDCHSQIGVDTLIVVTSRKEHTPDLALHALTDCWRGSGVKPVVQTVQAVNRPDQPYTLVVLKAVDDFSIQRPLRADFDSSGRGRLETVENPAESLPLPLERWASSAGTSVQNVIGELVVHTPQTRTAYALTYAPLIVPATGQYRFELKYKLQSGRIAFGAFPADESRWLASDILGHPTTTGRELVFSLDLRAGDTVLLRIANNNTRDAPSSFVIQSVRVAALRPAM